jgi:hypothetical protein
MQPTDVARSLSAEWPCREVQARQLASLLHVSKPPRFGDLRFKASLEYNTNIDIG